MVREEARRTLLREYDMWAKDHPDDATKHAVGGDKWATVHGWLYYTGRVKD
jgi:hypothetical protein